jgi:hypothetical protein
MLYRVKTTGAVKTQGEVRGLFPNTSLPAVWTTDTLEFLGVDPVFNAPQPIPTDLQQVAQQGVVQDAKGNWIENWILVDRFKTYINEENVTITKEEQETAYLAKLDAEAKKVVKDKASALLTASDFYDLPNTANKISNISDIIVYRDALRAIALNPTKDAVFPVKPETIWL